MPENPDPRFVDRRTFERYLRNRQLDEKDYERYLKNLPDLADKSATVETVMDESDDEQATPAPATP